VLPKYSTEWIDIPHEHEKAKPKGERRVVYNQLAIRIDEGFLRGSTFTGIFLIANVNAPFKVVKNELRVEVIVGWFGAKPKTSWTHITLKGKWKLLKNYSGPVETNITAR
jgi:hypothetical protein